MAPAPGRPTDRDAPYLLLQLHELRCRPVSRVRPRQPGAYLFRAGVLASAPQPTSSITAGAIVAVLITHLFVIGSTQEVLFRGFVMGFLENRWPTIYRLGPVKVPLSGLIAAVIFTLAHVKPFPPYAWPAQLAFSFIYGVIYAVMYRHTRSLLGPALAHGYSNAAYVAMMMLK